MALCHINKPHLTECQYHRPWSCQLYVRFRPKSLLTNLQNPFNLLILFTLSITQLPSSLQYPRVQITHTHWVFRDPETTVWFGKPISEQESKENVCFLKTLLCKDFTSLTVVHARLVLHTAAERLIQCIKGSVKAIKALEKIKCSSAKIHKMILPVKEGRGKNTFLLSKMGRKSNSSYQ